MAAAIVKAAYPWKVWRTVRFSCVPRVVQDEKAKGQCISYCLVCSCFLSGYFLSFLFQRSRISSLACYCLPFSLRPSSFGEFYRTFTQPDVRTLRDVREKRKQQEELIKVATETASPSLVYDQLLSKYLRGYDPKVAYDVLERRIEIYRMAGMSRGDAVKKIADEEGLKAS